MQRNYFKSKLFLKFIGSYLLILLIPLLFATVFIYRNAVNNLQSEIEQSHLNQLTQTKTVIDGRIKELSEISSRISYDQRLTPYRVHDPYDSMEAISALNNYKATSSIISEVFLYYHNDDRIYSSQGMSTLDVFAARYGFTNWSHKDLMEELNTARFPLMHPADTVNRNTYLQESMLAYTVPITPNSTNPHGSVLYLIRESEFASLISSVLGNYQGLTYIYDNNGQVLTHYGTGEKLSVQDTQSLTKLKPGIHDQKINNQSHSIVSVKSDKNGWTYVTLMASDQFFSSIIHVRSFIILLFFITLSIGAAMAYVLARRQYHPISELVNLASAKSGSVRSTGNELEHIRSTLQDYSSRVDLQEPYARNHVLSTILKYGSARSLTPDILEAFDLRLDQPNHFVMVFGWEVPEEELSEIQDRQAMVELLTRIEFPQLLAHAYGVELPQLNQIALMVSFDHDNLLASEQHVRYIVEAVRSHMLEMFEEIPALGVGTCYASPDQLNQSFIEACSAVELHTGQGVVTYFEKLSGSPDHTFLIPNAVLLKLSQSLKQGSYDVAEQIISTAIRDLLTSEHSALLTRCICYDILNTMLKTASELGIHNVMQEVASNMMSSSLDELERHFHVLAAKICSEVEQNHQKEEHSLMDQIVGYIDEHYMDHSLSLESVSYEYTISPSHLSRSFKEKVGINFIQYIWQKRMEEVQHQLKTTNDPLKDIIMRVGYLDTPNFIRKFKKETGYTPGQYRKLYADPAQVGDELPPDELT
ncbi:helix-turn-helix domain-containing protein [Paenibacillus terrigena]|uniref:helix-turn-helix domain-containing protein n=1 Tax=Paenibacillus terrigena TaxID=369333 RepID=UPI000363AD10|nr:helix-turn-helix domain-containing protein [Paenibacillus terrigena]